MAKKKTQIPKYGTITLKGIQYYRTRITDADGKELSLYATTCEELYEKQLEARKQVEEIIFHRQHPTVAEYGEKWLLMQSAKVSASTLRGIISFILCATSNSYSIIQISSNYAKLPQPKSEGKEGGKALQKSALG